MRTTKDAFPLEATFSTMVWLVAHWKLVIVDEPEPATRLPLAVMPCVVRMSWRASWESVLKVATGVKAVKLTPLSVVPLTFTCTSQCQ